MSLLHRVFHKTLKKSSPAPPLASPLAFEKRILLQDCILLLRNDINALQDRTNTAFSNLLTIIRCISSHLPRLQCHFYVHRYGFTQEELQCAIQFARSKYACRPFENIRAPRLSNPALEALAAKGEAALKCQSSSMPLSQKAEDKETPFPFTLTLANCMPLVSEEGQLRAELNLLVLQKAEMDVEVDRLEGNLLFWGGVWDDFLCAAKLGSIGKKKRDLRVEGVQPNSRSTVRRKEVPVKELLKRVVEDRPQLQEFLPQLGRVDSGIGMEMDEEEEEEEERYIDSLDDFFQLVKWTEMNTN